MTTPPVADRYFVSQFSNDEVLGLSLNVAGVPTDPEGNAVTAVMTNDATGAVALDLPATRASLGRYQVTLDGASTDVPGYYTLTFYYRMPDSDTISISRSPQASKNSTAFWGISRPLLRMCASGSRISSIRRKVVRIFRPTTRPIGRRRAMLSCSGLPLEQSILNLNPS
jgi:hypothetical protein